MAYLWAKAFHIIAMVAWFSGLFYLPRLFVYHSECNTEDAVGSERFKIMERRLFYGITTPAGIITILLGLWLLITNYAVYKYFLWMHLKLALVVILIVYHCYCGILVWDFKRDRNRHSPTFYRWFNEFPVLILVGVILLVVLKPGWTI